ncbi:hypothetical protein TRFO_17501 [Tritrichomonas foetus]|uniref:Metallo-beta-lactamase domain-containing protein n=1 Tax=Tritrichomonas foetus TaxID=1144522 RepID=A0A1J4KN56_9EUKA|nr:hypothetical protein TRFO_17501 [Tritrichomonas foetus]|eukprot:OHT12667.1 hypothetical protein TRFO_17501 [Tritrichomonas foetus]
MSLSASTSPPKRAEPRKPPYHFSVPGTNFTVDWHCKTFPNYIHSFLSHAHSDHLSGIQGFKAPRVLHCTEITAKMLILKVPKVQPCIQICQPNTTIVVEGVKVHVLNANHTPGSAMFVFELKNGKKILHTGDFRAEPSVVQSAAFFSPIDQLFMDCTYACSNINVPPRSECVNFVISKVKELLPRGFIITIGTYTIGKEELVFDVAEATACKVYAPETRMKTLRDLASSGYRSGDFLVDDKESAMIHLLGIQECNQDSSLLYAKSLGKTQIATFSVSGWNGRGFWKAPQVINRDGATCISYSVPYSDHSSNSELIEFVKATKPAKITSTTQTQPKQIEKINKMFNPYIRKSANKGFLDFYMINTSTQKSGSSSQCSQKSQSLENTQQETQNEFQSAQNEFQSTQNEFQSTQNEFQSTQREYLNSQSIFPNSQNSYDDSQVFLPNSQNTPNISQNSQNFFQNTFNESQNILHNSSNTSNLRNSFQHTDSYNDRANSTYVSPIFMNDYNDSSQLIQLSKTLNETSTESQNPTQREEVIFIDDDDDDEVEADSVIVTGSSAINIFSSNLNNNNNSNRNNSRKFLDDDDSDVVIIG